MSMANNSTSENIIEIPVNVHLVQDPDGEITTIMAIEDVRAMFEEVNRIWGPANIEFTSSIGPLEINLQSLQELIDEQRTLPRTKNTIDLYYVENLRGWERFQGENPATNPNGLTFPGLSNSFVKDNPDAPVTNHRCIAHEFGHDLGLEHYRIPIERVMAEGQAGEELAAYEIARARNITMRFFS